MKKFLLFLGAVTGLLYASPVGNTEVPELIEIGFFIPCESWINVRAGYEGDFVYDARMEQHKEGKGRVDRYKQMTNSGVITVNLVDRMDVYGLFGASWTKANWRFSDSTGEIHRSEVETHYNFLWGVGARAIFFEWGNAALGAGGRYSSCDAAPAWLTIDGVETPVEGTHLLWNQWQVNLDLAYRIDLFVPYIGIKYSEAHAKLGTFSTAIANDGSGKDQFRTRVPVGLYLGCAISNRKYFMLNIEGRFIDEEAMTISADLRF